MEHRNGYLSGCLYFVLGFLLGPIGLIMACFIPSNKPTPVAAGPCPVYGAHVTARPRHPTTAADRGEFTAESSNIRYAELGSLPSRQIVQKFRAKTH
jgi:hypothetical protein